MARRRWPSEFRDLRQHGRRAADIHAERQGCVEAAHKYGIPNMYDATRCVENAYMIKWKDPQYSDKPVKEILRELLSYGDGCTISAKKDFLVNMGGLIACNSPDLNRAFLRMLRIWEGDVTNGGLDSKDIEALHRGLMDSLDDDYIKMRIAQTQEFGAQAPGGRRADRGAAWVTCCVHRCETVLVLRYTFSYVLL